ncbi:SRPBCC family protein [Desulfobotulus alkaliphilus]|uniref:hypothetical protein n=1 Tax=Desulfobotulus alkaliphilus TaxID=622671 RepID=UPI0016493B14|nr:hypothetical protein [Desulfobotulus alkaliphilus]
MPWPFYIGQAGVVILFPDRWSRYHFEESWFIEAPLKKVWDGVVHVEDWPIWWEGLITSSSPDALPAGIQGKSYNTRWRGALSYRLDVGAVIREIKPEALIRADIYGDIQGECLCCVEEEMQGTRGFFDLHVRTMHPWMTLLSPFLKSYFSENHKRIMVKGIQGFRRHLAEGDKI